MDPVSIPWWLTILTTAFTMAVSGAIAAVTYRQKLNRAWRPPAQDGDGLVLRYGPGMRLFVPIMITVVGVGVGTMMVLTWEESEDWVRTMYVVVGLFSLAVWPFVFMWLWLYRLQVEERGVQVTGIWSTRTISYNMIVGHKEKEDEVVFKLVDGGKLRITKELSGWAQAQLLIRRHAGLNAKPVEFSYPKR